MSDINSSEKLINALLDNQLDAAEAARVSKEIAADPKLSATLADFTRQRNAISKLPNYQLGDGFADRVVELATLDSDNPQLLQRPPADSVDWKKYAMTLAAIAALLMAMLVFQWTPGGQISGSDVAVLNDTNNATATGTSADKITDEVEGKVIESFDDDAVVSSSSLAGKREAKKRQTTGNKIATSSKNAFPLGVADSNIAGSSLGENDLPYSNDPAAPAFSDMPSSSFSGTAMALRAPKPDREPVSQSPAAIDQVWLIEVDEDFSQAQLMEALASNSIELPRQESGKSFVTKDNGGADEVGGIHVAANVKQMKNALAQLAQSDTVTISTYQLPGSPVRVGGELEKSSKQAFAAKPLQKIAPSRRAMAQHLRGNHFRRSAPLPSSKIPETFEKLEAMMAPLASGLPNGLADSQFGEQVAGESDSRSPASLNRALAKRSRGTIESIGSMEADELVGDKVRDAPAVAADEGLDQKNTKQNEMASVFGEDADRPSAAPAVVMSESEGKSEIGPESSKVSQLLTGGDLESGELKNFLILIRRTPSSNK